MSQTQANLPQDELNYLSHTLDFIRREMTRLEEMLERRRNDDYVMARQIYDEGLAMRDNAHAELANLNHELSENQSSYSQATVRYRHLGKVASSPYFGSIDYLYPDEDEAESWHIGLMGLQDLETFTQYVIDWRSPLASVYYEYEIGPASFDSPVGRVDGQVTGKRQIVIREGKLLRVLDTGQEIHDEILQEVLSRTASPRMRNIVATLQRDQNRLVRVPAKDNLIIQGAAGSGKTSIALHRAAYLLYSNPELKAVNILLVTPNEQLQTYVSEVLPDLNEEQTPSITWLQLALEELGAIEGRFHRIKPGDVSPARAARAGSREFLAKVLRFCDEYAEKIFAARDIVTPSTTISAATIKQFYLDNYRYYPPLKRAQQLVDNIGDLMARGGRGLERAFPKEREQILRDLQSMYQARRLSDLYLAWIRWARQDEPDDPMATGQEWLSERLDAEDKERRARQRQARQVLEASGEELADIDPAESEAAAAAVPVPERWDEADIAVLALLALRFFGPSGSEEYRVSHLIVDEMQDLYPLTHQWLAERFNCPATVLGDVNQALSYPLPEGFLGILSQLYGMNGPVQEARLLESYRSTYEITEFSKHLLDLDEVIPFKRSGDPVRQLYLDDTAALTGLLKEELLAAKDSEDEMAAILVPDLALARDLKKELVAVPVRRARQTDGMLYQADELSFDPDQQAGPLWQIMPLAHCQGLEFDRVLVVRFGNGALVAEALRRSGQSEHERFAELSEDELAQQADAVSHQDRLRLYVAATRALHSLTFIDLEA